jgi:hypothetical protein
MRPSLSTRGAGDERDLAVELVGHDDLLSGVSRESAGSLGFDRVIDYPISAGVGAFS